MSIVENIIREFVWLFIEMAPYLLLGFLIAGFLHVYLPQRHIDKYLGSKSWGSVVRAAIFGVPLPLCSCGVIPTGISLHQNGASKGAAVSFLISTPQTGVDSILITYSLMGLPFAIIRPIAAFITGVLGGQITNKLTADEPAKIIEETIVTNTGQAKESRIKKMFEYALVEFLEDIVKWLLIGLGIAAVISAVIPDDFFANHLTNSTLNMLIILVASIPLYVCATGSVPIAATLMMKGLSPGAAFVFLMAGPATNAGTITVIGQSMGKKALLGYLGTIIAGALAGGFIINEFMPAEWFNIATIIGHQHHVLPEWLQYSTSAILALAMIRGILRKTKLIKPKNKTDLSNKGMIYRVEGMTCNHCKANVEKNIANLGPFDRVEADHMSDKLIIEGEGIDEKKIAETIEGLGYQYKGRY